MLNDSISMHWLKRCLWIGQQNGVLDQLNLQLETFSSYQIPQLEGSVASYINTNALLEIRNGNFWIGTDESGLYQFQIENKQFERYESGTTTRIPIEETGINSLFEDSNGILWICTFTGLYRLDPERGTIKQYLIRMSRSPILILSHPLFWMRRARC